MPYLRYLYCEDCGFPANLDVDYIKTIEAYVEDGRKKAVINDATVIWDYLIYSCHYCHKSFRYIYTDVERRVREFLSSMAQGKFDLDRIIDVQSSEENKRRGTYFIEKDRMKKMYSKE